MTNETKNAESNHMTMNKSIELEGGYPYVSLETNILNSSKAVLVRQNSGLMINEQPHNDGYYPDYTTTPDALTSWTITDFGQVGKLSRDGSIHATDEVFNTGSHFMATLLSILGTALLIAGSVDTTNNRVWKIVSFALYGSSLIFLFACSTLHHGITCHPSYEHKFRVLDYLAIYPLIANTFTPLCLVFYHDAIIGWVFGGTVWGISLFGMVMTACYFRKIPKWLSMTMYLTLGWLGGTMSYWLIPKLTGPGYGLFLLGGAFYSIGGIVYSIEKPNPFPGKFGFHEIWHIAVFVAAVIHWFMMYLYVLPS